MPLNTLHRDLESQIPHGILKGTQEQMVVNAPPLSKPPAHLLKYSDSKIWNMP